MTRTTSRFLIVASTLAGLTGFSFPGSAHAQFPSMPINDVTQSLGQFTIKVAPQFQPMVQNLVNSGELPASSSPGVLGSYYWQPHQGFLTSPLMYDQMTTIGLSAALTVGSPQASAGVTVGTSNPATITSSDYPMLPSGWYGPNGTREVYTQMTSMDLTTLGGSYTSASVLAGIANGLPLSPGQVESTTGSPASDFPAKSFFDIFPQINITTTTMGTFSFTTGTTPLLVESTGLTSLPPTVLYTHDNTSSVPIVFSSGPDMGQTFGVIELAGHGAGYGQTDEGLFNSQYDAMLAAASAPEPSTLTMYLIAATALAGYGWNRRRHRVT